MTQYEFLETYQKKNSIDIFECSYEFFSNELPEDFVDNYDVIEIVCDIHEHFESTKKFDNMLKFNQLIQEKHSGLYQECFKYLDTALIDYYCYLNDPQKIEIAFSNFMKDPLNDYDMFLFCFKKLLYYHKIDLLDKVIHEKFEEIAESEDLIYRAELDLAVFKFYNILETYYLKSRNTHKFRKKEFYAAIKEYEFKFKKEKIFAIADGALMPPDTKECLKNSFRDNREIYMFTLIVQFLKYMRERNFSFALSGAILEKYLLFWENGKQPEKATPDEFFYADSANFEKFLSRNTRFNLIENNPELIAILWGGVYIYDFLQAIEMIGSNVYNKFMEIIKIQKGIVINQSIGWLWKYDFVHNWVKPDSISDSEFIEEGKIFRKSIDFNNSKFTRQRKEISDELSRMGELSHYIISGGRKVEGKSLFSNIVKGLEDDLGISEAREIKKIDNNWFSYPEKTADKIGRNEPCPCGSGKKYKKCCGKLN